MSLQDDLKALRRRMIEVCAASGEGHLPSSLSVLEIIHTLHTQIMTPNCRFILSKGHAALALYVVLESIGKIPSAVVDQFCQPGAELLGHPERNLKYGIEATAGSLGHGLPMAVGLAYALRLNKDFKGRVFCLVGDGECHEGSIWEAAQIAATLGLPNLVCMVDENRSNELPNQHLGNKFSAFGWAVDTISGHAANSIIKGCDRPDINRPLALIANTIKGHGVTACELDPRAWHHRKVTQADAEKMIAAL